MMAVVSYASHRTIDLLVYQLLILRTTKKYKVSFVRATTSCMRPTFRLRDILLVWFALHLVGNFMDLKREDWCALKNLARKLAQDPLNLALHSSCSINSITKDCALYFRTEWRALAGLCGFREVFRTLV